MRTELIILCCVAALSGAGCAGDSRKAANQPAPSNSNAQAPASTKDIGKLGAEIASLEAQAAKDPDDRALRDSLAESFVRRGNLHLEARRLSEALSDFQNALSHKPDHDEAQERISQISSEMRPEPVGDDGRPVTVPAKPGAANANQ